MTMNIERTAGQYNKVSLWVMAALTILGLMVSQIEGCEPIIIPIVISALFSILCAKAYITGWKAIARRSPETLSKYYLAASAFRLMTAAVVLLIYCVVERTDITAIKYFAVVFIVYYIVMLILDALFFAKVSKTNYK